MTKLGTIAASFFLAALALCANAADMALVGQAPAAVTSTWTGLYLGAGAGLKKSQSEWTTNCFSAACETGGANVFFVDSSSPRAFDGSAFRGNFYAGLFATGLGLLGFAAHRRKRKTLAI